MSCVSQKRAQLALSLILWGFQAQTQPVVAHVCIASW